MSRHEATAARRAERYLSDCRARGGAGLERAQRDGLEGEAMEKRDLARRLRFDAEKYGDEQLARRARRLEAEAAGVDGVVRAYDAAHGVAA